MLWLLFGFWMGCAQEVDMNPLQDEINVLKQKIEVLEQNQNSRLQQEEQEVSLPYPISKFGRSFVKS